MKLADIVENYKYLRLAQPEDNQKILAFLRSIPMKMGKFSFRYEYLEHFEKFLSYQSKRRYVIVMEDEKGGDVKGYAVLSVRDYYLHGKLTEIAYLSDLRVSRDLCREAKNEWKVAFIDFQDKLHEMEEFSDCSFFYCAILSANTRAKEALFNRTDGVIFKEIVSYKAISLLAKKPFKSLSSQFPELELSYSKQDEKDKLREFLISQNKKKCWGDYFDSSTTEDEWARREKNWDSFDFNNFITIRDRNKKIVACTKPWSPSKARAIVVDKMPMIYKLLGKVFKFMGRNTFAVNYPLDILYLTHLEIAPHLTTQQKNQALEMILSAVYQTSAAKKAHMVTFMTGQQSEYQKTLDNFFLQTSDSSLYQIFTESHAEREVEFKQLEAGVAFELAIA